MSESDGLGTEASLLRAAQLLTADQLPALISGHAARLGAVEAVIYLADLQQAVLVPFLGDAPVDVGRHLEPLGVDGTTAGWAFQTLRVVAPALGQDSADPVTVWIPLLNGSERLGVLAVEVPRHAASGHDDRDEAAWTPWWSFAAAVAELVMTKTMHGDAIVRARRRAQMGLAAEIQWGLLPPLAFACETVAVAGALEPAYDVAGDSLDYAVDARLVRLAVFDGMGHGLHSAQLAAMSVAAYRNARRSTQSLTQTAAYIDDVLRSVFGGEAFTTAVLAELDTETGQLSWVNAGHPAPLILRNGECVATLDADPGLPFGMDLSGKDSGYRVSSVRLELGDDLVLYTDGMVEARTPTGEPYGLPRLLDLLTRHMVTGLPIAECLRRLVRALMDHQQGQLSDDATIMLLHWHSVPQTDRQRLDG